MSSKKLAWSLILLAFASKVSLSFTGIVPSSAGWLLFQGGIHPYVNVALNFFLGFCLYLSLRAEKAMPSLKEFRRPYAIFAIGTLAILWVQHFLQMFLHVEEAAPLLVLITMGCTTFLVAAFGVVIPRLISPREFVQGVGLLCGLICAFSLLLYFAGFPALYKGSRFIGILKHIPYMVTSATVGYLFGLARFDLSSSWKHRAGWALLQVCCLYALWLTGTRSALFAVLLGTFFWLVTMRPPSPSFQLARTLLVWLALLGGLLFGTFAYDFSRDLLTGKTSIGSRAPQDGVSDRMAEIYRGLEMLEKAPWVGLGLLSKFSDAEGEDVVSSYNSFQDPHNLFISSAVVAGYPFGAWVAFGFLMAIAVCIQAVTKSQLPGIHMIGIYLLSHLPILAIYHMHLSLGGLADRLYWLAFGYLGLKWANLPQKDLVKS